MLFMREKNYFRSPDFSQHISLAGVAYKYAYQVCFELVQPQFGTRSRLYTGRIILNLGCQAPQEEARTNA